MGENSFNMRRVANAFKGFNLRMSPAFIFQGKPGEPGIKGQKVRAMG